MPINIPPGGSTFVMNGTTYVYDSKGKLVGKYDPAGNYQSYDNTTNTWGQTDQTVPSSGSPTPSGGSSPASDAYFQQLKALSQAQSIADAAARREAVQQALIAFGLVPSNFQDKYGDITQLVKDLAAKNTTAGISTYARLVQARKDAMTALFNRLSSRGLRRSGAKGFGMNKNQLAYDQNYADALNSLLSYVRNAYSNFSSSEYQRQLSLLQALATASQNWYPPSPSSNTSTTTTSTPPSTSTPYSLLPEQSYTNIQGGYQTYGYPTGLIE